MALEGKSVVALLLTIGLFMALPVVSLGKVTHCYECVWDSESLDGSKACSESEGEMGKEDLVHECDEELGHDVCFFKYTIDIVDEETFERGCANSEEMFAGEKDKCESFVRFGEENHVCVCDSTNCNAAPELERKALFFLVFAAAALVTAAVGHGM